MDGRKLHHFVCFAVTMGLVACASGNTDPSSATNLTATVLQSETESTTELQVNSTANSTTTELATTSRFMSSGPAPSNTVTLSVRTMEPSQSKSCTTAKPAEQIYQKALFLIIAGALLFTCVVLLVTVTALACKVSYLRGRLSDSRLAQINGAGHWAGGREGGDVAGVGVAETSVMLEEVTPVQSEETATATAVATEPSGAQAAADEAGPAEEADRGPTAAAAAAPEPEPAPAADPDPVESPKTQTAPAPTSEPTADKA